LPAIQPDKHARPTQARQDRERVRYPQIERKVVRNKNGPRLFPTPGRDPHPKRDRIDRPTPITFFPSVAVMTFDVERGDGKPERLQF
jgi:hypothetical protein